jgi:hypothetical protein
VSSFFVVACHRNARLHISAGLIHRMTQHVVCLGSAHLDFLNAMVAEHCTKEGSQFEFETPNYAIKSTPYREWRLVVGEEKDLPELDMRFGRRIPDIAELMTLDVAKRAKLIKAEVIAVVLYTGPMVIIPFRNLG